jgi:DNA-binding MarR family transcriptional regulator
MTFLDMVTRKRGDRSKILLNQVDVMILQIIQSSKKEVSNRYLKAQLKINDLSLRNHIARLLDSNFITREKAPSENRYILRLTKDGSKVLTIFKKLI